VSFAADPIPLVDGDLRILHAFVSKDEGDALLALLRTSIPWEQHRVRIHGRAVDCPRLSCWLGDPGARYAYSGLVLEPRPWGGVSDLRLRIAAELDVPFNSALANLYRDGRDSMGWHSDDEPELGPEPTIASLSLGAVRRFRLRHRRRSDLEPVALDLPHGSLLVMRGATQRHWRHQVPKTRRPVAPRLNLTFRWVDPDPLVERQ
jgi:alkylated DNA repair dioxygenase AlkB